MAAQVDTMFSVRTVPWHREGVILGDYPGTWAEARKQAGLSWEPLTQPVYRLDGIDPDGQPLYQQITEAREVIRSDTGAHLAMTTDTYTLIDHGEMGQIVEAVLEQPNVQWETAGSLSGGTKVWCLARLNEPIELPGDTSTTYPYLAITNHHDGTGACALRATTVRIVCANTFSAAELEGQRTDAVFRFRHTKGWRDRISDARDAVTGARRATAAYEELARDLLGISVTAAQRELFVREFIPTPPDGLVSDRVLGNIDSARQAMRGILGSQTTVAVADTAFGLVQAAGEYLDHVRRAHSWETRLNRSVLRPEPLKARALTLVREVVKN